MPSTDPSLRVVILAGGIGSRFWPASTPARPKPLLPLGAPDRTLIAETVERARSLVPIEEIAVLTGESLAKPIREAAPELEPASLWVEPRARGTGPVLTWAAHRIFAEDPEAVMVSLHSDHVIRPQSAFASLIPAAARVARGEDLLFTIGVEPDRPETGYGYIRPGDSIGGSVEAETFRVGAFVEKPDRETAERYVSEGYLWNTGLFILPVDRFLQEVREHAPEIGRHLTLLDEGDASGFFEAVPTISVDEAVLERSSRVGAARANFGWDDVGSWEALTRTHEADPRGNFTVGDVHAVDSSGIVAWGEEGPVVLFGVRDLVVVRSGGVTLVSSRERAPDLKSLLEQLPASLRDPAGEPSREGGDA